MRKVRFNYFGTDIDGYFVGIAGACTNSISGNSFALIVVEDEDGRVYSISEESVVFTSKPQNITPIKRLDLKLMRNALVSINSSDMEKPYTLEDLLKLAGEKNIIIEDTEGFD